MELVISIETERDLTQNEFLRVLGETRDRLQREIERHGLPLLDDGQITLTTVVAWDEPEAEITFYRSA